MFCYFKFLTLLITLVVVSLYDTYAESLFSVRQIQQANNSSWYPLVSDDCWIYTVDVYKSTIASFNKISDEKKDIVSSGYTIYLGDNNNVLYVNAMNPSTGATQLKSTTDFGLTWKALHSDLLINPTSIIFKGQDTALIFAIQGQSAGRIFATYDGFKTTAILYESNSIYGYSCNPKGNVVLFSNAIGDLFRSEDFGKTYTADTYFGSDKNGRINMIKQINGKVFVTTQDGKLIVSNDSADSWESLSVPGISNYYFRSMDNDSEGNYYLTVSTDSDGKVLKSSNFIDWEIICSVDNSINNVVAVSPNKIVFGGARGGIWVAERTSAVIEDTSRSDIEVSIQGNCILINSNNAELPADANVSLVDMSGKQHELANLNSTNSTIELQISNKLSKGVYFLNINGENINISKKILVD